MASADFALFNQGTGANQNSNQNYALPGMLPQTTSPGGGANFSLFAGGPGSTSDVRITGPFSPISGPPSGGGQPITGGPVPTPPNGAVSPPPPGVVPPSSTPVNTNPAPGTWQGATGGPSSTQPLGGYGGVKNVGSGAATVNPLFPYFTSDFYSYLLSQMGQGATPFNLSANLPGGGTTAAGQLSAPLNNVDQMLQSFYTTGTGGPAGTPTLAAEAQTGLPTDVTPAWQAMVAAENKNTQENAANLREQFAFGGDLKSSPFGNAMTDFYNQNTLNQNAQLTAAQQQASEAAAGRQATAAQELTQGATGMGSQLQGIDQQAIDNMLAEFIRTSPDYSPLLSQIGGAATTFPPVSIGNVGIGGLGGAAASAGSALSGIADLWGALNSGGTGSTNQGGVVSAA